MSQNVEFVRSILARWEQADFRSLSWADPDIEYSILGGPEPGTWNGIEEMTRSVRAFMSAWEDYGIEAEEYRELDDARVLVFVRLSGRGKISGLRIEDMGALGAEVWQIRAGRVVKLALYWHREQALAELGLAA